MRTLLTTATLLSQRAPLAAVVGALPGKPYWKRVARIPCAGCDQAKRGCASRVPASAGAPHETGDGGESDPTVFAADTARGRAKVVAKAASCPPCGEVALTTLVFAGRLSSWPGNQKGEQETTDIPKAERGKPGGCTQPNFSDP